MKLVLVGYAMFFIGCWGSGFMLAHHPIDVWSSLLLVMSMVGAIIWARAGGRESHKDEIARELSWIIINGGNTTPVTEVRELLRGKDLL